MDLDCLTELIFILVVLSYINDDFFVYLFLCIFLSLYYEELKFDSYISHIGLLASDFIN